MVVFRCTQKLRRRMGPLAAKESASAKSSGRLGDWYANAISVRGQQLVLGVSGITLLPVLMPAAPYKTMLPRVAQATGDILRALGIGEAQVVAEAEAMRDLVVAPTNNRRVLGSMNDFAWMMEAYLEDTPTLLAVALKLAESPCSPLGMKNPREATLTLFSAPTLRLVKG